MIGYGDNTLTCNNSRFADYIPRDVVLRSWTRRADKKAAYNARNSNTKLDVMLEFEQY